MIRNVPHLLLTMLLGLALVLSGAASVAARVSMTMTTEMVICGQAGPQLIVLDAAGQPVTTKTPRDCATCPDCLAVGAFVMTAQPQVVAPQRWSSAAEPARSAISVSMRALWHAQPRAPPKGI